MPTQVYIVSEDGSFVLETKLNKSQYLIEYLDERGSMTYFSSNFSLADYVTMYEYEGEI